MRWFRFYAEVADDPKVCRLPDKQFKQWVMLLCIACKNDGTLPCDEDVAYTLRLSILDARKVLINFIDKGLLERFEDGALKPHNWDARQFHSDVSTKRVQAFRERKKQHQETVLETVSETFHETVSKRPRARDTDTETEYTPIVPVSGNGKPIEKYNPQTDIQAECDAVLERVRNRHAANYRHAMQLNQIRLEWMGALAKRLDDPLAQARIIDKAHERACSTDAWSGKYREALHKWLARSGYMDEYPELVEENDGYIDGRQLLRDQEAAGAAQGD